VDLNLDTLKQEILAYLDTAGFAVYHSSPGGLEGMPMVLWDAVRFPDYQLFLDVARKADTRMILFASREFESADLDELIEQLESSDMDRADQRAYQARLRELREHEGSTCTIELAFDYHSRLYVYELQPDWYEEFLTVEDEIAAQIADDESEGGDTFGYFSKN
jgi:hypothetical protein